MKWDFERICKFAYATVRKSTKVWNFFLKKKAVMSKIILTKKEAFLKKLIKVLIQKALQYCKFLSISRYEQLIKKNPSSNLNLNGNFLKFVRM